MGHRTLNGEKSGVVAPAIVQAPAITETMSVLSDEAFEAERRAFRARQENDDQAAERAERNAVALRNQAESLAYIYRHNRTNLVDSHSS